MDEKILSCPRTRKSLRLGDKSCGPLKWPLHPEIEDFVNDHFTKNLDPITKFESDFQKIIFNLVTVVLYHIPIRYLLLAWGTKKLSIYGIKPNYKDNNELLGKIPIFELTYFHLEIREIECRLSLNSESRMSISSKLGDLEIRNSVTHNLMTWKFGESLFDGLEIRRPQTNFESFRFLVQNPNDTRIETLQIRNCD